MILLQSNFEKEFIKTLDGYRYKYNIYQLFNDFCQCAACAINSPLEQHDKRESQYSEIIGRYQNEDMVKLFGDLFGMLILGLEENPFTDVLGNIYMQLEITDKKHLGQCFTLGSVSGLCGQLAFDSRVQKQVEQDSFVTLNDCCVGGGSMVLAFADAMKKAGFNPQKELCVVCNDIDNLCVNMAYIQLSLNGIPGIVFKGDTITQRFTDYFHTPMWMLSDYHFKYERWFRESKNFNQVVSYKDIERMNQNGTVER